VFVTAENQLLRRSNFARRAMRPATDGNLDRQLGPVQMVQVGHEQQVFPAGEQVVHRSELPGDPDRRTHPVRRDGQVVSRDEHLTGVRA
jgi:hypothetical protein